ncbi:sulfite exporter TauE/SafE family protein [Thaumasiovibrio subtropicus]|uniref:sulfite exporter TauE/SafE family protein n=1 Tax=Thaumasiovibrio subtropicus TaxID=1891207 RepID=UPI000B350F22|nr:sulfite exporter TauE/SafE family protein [Thaumasiovibrio subtropicus]
MEISVLVFSALALAVGCFVQSSIGFGMAIVAAPIVFFFEPRFVPGTLTFMGLILAGTNTYQLRKHISYRGLGAAFVGRVPGTLVAGWLLMVMTSQQLAIVLGGGVLLAVVVSLSKVKIQPTNQSLFWAGFASGVMGTATSIGGPPMAIVLQHAEGGKLRANLSAYFLFSCILSLFMLSYTGHFSWWHVKYALIMLPPSLIAIWFSTKVQHLIKAEWMRMAILILCSISGLTALHQGITG